MDLAPFPSLPTEIQIQVLQTAILHEDSELWRFLALSRDTTEWLEVYLYESVVLTGRTDETFLQLIIAKPRRALYVRSLCLTYRASHEMGKAVVALCRNVQRLAYWCAEGKELHVVLATLERPLLSLSGWFGHFPIDLGAVRFQSLQYLDVLDEWADIKLAKWRWEELGGLKNLRRLLLDDAGFVDACSEVLADDAERAMHFREVVCRVVEQVTPVEYLFGSESVFQTEKNSRIRCIVRPSGRSVRTWWLHTTGESWDE